jgi:hypothetical protein
MNNKIAGLVMASILLVLLGGIAEQVYLPAGTISHLQILLQPSITQTTTSSSASFLGIVVGIVDAGKAWISTFWDMLWFNYPFMNNGVWSIVRVLLWLPVSISIGFGLIQMFSGRSSIG